MNSRLSNVRDPLVHRMSLPPVETSPAAARRAVATLLATAGLDHLRKEAQLLTSELVTNGVLHARSEIDLEIRADRAGVQVTVTDFGPTPEFASAEITGASRGEGVGGRGLFLVAQFASRWGTTHDAEGRSVWFQLSTGLDSDEDSRETDEATAATPQTPELGIDAAAEAIVGSPEPGEPGNPVATLTNLLGRLAEVLAAQSATISVDHADGRGAAVLARYTAEEAPTGGHDLRLPLRLSRPSTGELAVVGAQGSHAESIAALMTGQFSLLIENQRLQEAYRERQGWLLFLAEAGELLAQSVKVSLTAALLPRLIVPRLGVWCAVHLANEYGELRLAATTHIDENELPTLASHLEYALPRIARALYNDSPTPIVPPLGGLVFPLVIRGDHVGTLTVGPPVGRNHNAEERAILLDLGRRAVVAIDNARTHDNRRRIANALQQSLLPPALPSIGGLEVAARYEPAGEGLEVGGDFYDLIRVPGRGWLLAVGDVSGKGARAAAVTGLVREVLHALALDYHSAEHTLNRLNAALVRRGGGYFCTLALAFFESATTEPRDVALHLAGHDQPVLLRADGSADYVGAGGTALGLLDSIRAPSTTIRLHRGDALVLYTDGVTERRNGNNFYGKRRLKNVIANLAGLPAGVLAAQLRTSVLGFSPAPPRDDIAIVAVRAVPTDEANPGREGAS